MNDYTKGCVMCAPLRVKWAAENVGRTVVSGWVFVIGLWLLNVPVAAAMGSNSLTNTIPWAIVSIVVSGWVSFVWLLGKWDRHDEIEHQQHHLRWHTTLTPRQVAERLPPPRHFAAAWRDQRSIEK